MQAKNMQTTIGYMAEKPVMTDKTTSSEVVMSMLHDLVLTADTKRLVIDLLTKEVEREEASVRMKELYRLKKDLELFASYQENWDDEGGRPLTKKVIENFEALLPFISVGSLQNIDIYPENNGSLLVMSRTKEAGVNIGNSTFSYYVVHENLVSGESHLEFTVDDALKRIEEIAQG